MNSQKGSKLTKIAKHPIINKPQHSKLNSVNLFGGKTTFIGFGNVVNTTNYQ